MEDGMMKPFSAMGIDLKIFYSHFHACHGFETWRLVTTFFQGLNTSTK